MPRCGAPARYAGRRDKRFTSVLGELRVARAYYRCDACGAGFCPRDAALGVQGASLSPGVTRMVGQVGALVSFAEGSELLRALAGVDVATKHVERAAEARPAMSQCWTSSGGRRAQSALRRPSPLRWS